MKRALIFGLLVLGALWPAILNGGAFWFPDTTNYIRAADAAVAVVTGSPSVWSDRLDSVVVQFGDGEASAPFPEATEANPAPDRIIYSGRSIYYGFLAYLPMRIGGPWAAITLQSFIVCGLAAFCLHLALRDRLNNPIRAVHLILAGAIVFTPFPFYVSMLMPDIYSGLAILTLGVLIALHDRLSLGERWILFAATAAMSTFHTTILLLCLVIGALTCVLSYMRLVTWRAAAAIIPVVAIAITAGLAFNIGVQTFAKQSPISPPFLSARLTSAGPGVTLLNEDCKADSSSWEICQYRDRLPQPSDLFLWGESEENGVFQLADMNSKRAMAEQDKAFFLAVLADQPLDVLRVSAQSTIEQFVSFDLKNYNYPSSRQQLFSKYPRPIADQIASTRAVQDTMPTTFTVWSSILITIASIAALLFFAIQHKRLEVNREVIALTVILIVAFCANSAICGALSGPHARYQMRLLWLLPMSAAILACFWPRLRSPQREILAQWKSS